MVVMEKKGEKKEECGKKVKIGCLRKYIHSISNFVKL